MVSSFKQFLGEMLFPSFCCACKTVGPYLCRYCYAYLEFYSLPIHLEKLPLTEVFLDELIATVEYEKTIGSVLHHLKYKHAKNIGQYLGELLYHTIDFPPADYISAVPLYFSRQKERGFNQAEIIAKHLAQKTAIPFQQFLKRVKKTAPQASLRNQSSRLHNLEGIFEIIQPAPELHAKTILLIDDVCTTGSTLNECAKVLKKNGAKRVIGLCVAHGS